MSSNHKAVRFKLGATTPAANTPAVNTPAANTPVRHSRDPSPYMYQLPVSTQRAGTPAWGGEKPATQHEQHRDKAVHKQHSAGLRISSSKLEQQVPQDQQFGSMFVSGLSNTGMQNHGSEFSRNSDTMQSQSDMLTAQQCHATHQSIEQRTVTQETTAVQQNQTHLSLGQYNHSRDTAGAQGHSTMHSAVKDTPWNDSAAVQTYQANQSAKQHTQMKVTAELLYETRKSTEISTEVMNSGAQQYQAASLDTKNRDTGGVRQYQTNQSLGQRTQVRSTTESESLVRKSMEVTAQVMNTEGVQEYQAARVDRKGRGAGGVQQYQTSQAKVHRTQSKGTTQELCQTRKSVEVHTQVMSTAGVQQYQTKQGVNLDSKGRKAGAVQQHQRRQSLGRQTQVKETVVQKQQIRQSMEQHTQMELGIAQQYQAKQAAKRGTESSEIGMQLYQANQTARLGTDSEIGMQLYQANQTARLGTDSELGMQLYQANQTARLGTDSEIGMQLYQANQTARLGTDSEIGMQLYQANQTARLGTDSEIGMQLYQSRQSLDHDIQQYLTQQSTGMQERAGVRSYQMQQHAQQRETGVQQCLTHQVTGRQGMAQVQSHHAQQQVQQHQLRGTGVQQCLTHYTGMQEKAGVQSYQTQQQVQQHLQQREARVQQQQTQLYTGLQEKAGVQSFQTQQHTGGRTYQSLQSAEQRTNMEKTACAEQYQQMAAHQVKQLSHDSAVQQYQSEVLKSSKETLTVQQYQTMMAGGVQQLGMGAEMQQYQQGTAAVGQQWSQATETKQQSRQERGIDHFQSITAGMHQGNGSAVQQHQAERSAVQQHRANVVQQHQANVSVVQQHQTQASVVQKVSNSMQQLQQHGRQTSGAVSNTGVLSHTGGVMGVQQHQGTVSQVQHSQQEISKVHQSQDETFRVHMHQITTGAQQQSGETGAQRYQREVAGVQGHQREQSGVHQLQKDVMEFQNVHCNQRSEQHQRSAIQEYHSTTSEVQQHQTDTSKVQLHQAETSGVQQSQADIAGVHRSHSGISIVEKLQREFTTVQQSQTKMSSILHKIMDSAAHLSNRNTSGGALSQKDSAVHQLGIMDHSVLKSFASEHSLHQEVTEVAQTLTTEQNSGALQYKAELSVHQTQKTELVQHVHTETSHEQHCSEVYSENKALRESRPRVYGGREMTRFQVGQLNVSGQEMSESSNVQQLDTHQSHTQQSAVHSSERTRSTVNEPNFQQAFISANRESRSKQTHAERLQRARSLSASRAVRQTSDLRCSDTGNNNQAALRRCSSAKNLSQNVQGWNSSTKSSTQNVEAIYSNDESVSQSDEDSNQTVQRCVSAAAGSNQRSVRSSKAKNYSLAVRKRWSSAKASHSQPWCSNTKVASHNPKRPSTAKPPTQNVTGSRSTTARPSTAPAARRPNTRNHTPCPPPRRCSSPTSSSQTARRRCSSAGYSRPGSRCSSAASSRQGSRVRCASARSYAARSQTTTVVEEEETELQFNLTVTGLIPGEGGEYVPRGNLSTIEVESLMREKVRSKYDSLKQAFQTYDVDQNETVTKGEFRRVLESYCFPMNTEQFDTVLNKVYKTHSGSIKYVDFLQKFYGAGNQARLRPVRSGPGAPREVNMDVIERLLKDKISQNLKSVVRGMQLFDYNMDGKIQRHELRRVLENYCFKFTDTQFDKLWLRYDFHHTGLVNYRDFLQRLGVNAKLQGKTPANNAAGALKWPAVVNQQQQQAPASQFASTRVREQHKQDEALLQVLNFDQIEIEFRSRMKDNYQRLKKAFMALDKHLDGFVTIEDLRAILSNFTLPMSDQLFAQLMARCGVRGTNRVAWELFLEKFQNPVAVGNGQTIPIQSNHKFHPVMETQEVVSWDAIWRQLYKHVQNGYSSMKQAFLQFDKNRDGKVTKKEFRQIIEKFTFRLEDSQFKEMMSRLNLSQGPWVSYHDFLDIFEEKESLKEGHKWLKSVHRFNDKPKPAIMAWETVEDLLQEKITQYWKNVAENLMLYDMAAKGYVTPKQMKRVIDRQVMPISDDHYAHLLERCEDRTEGKVNYVEFLTKLKVDVRPGDLVGLSTQIMDSSGRAEMRRQTDQYVRQQMIDDNAVSRTHEMTAEEVIIRIKDKMSQHTSEIRKAFLSCDKQGKGRITKRQFREILANLGMLMTDQQYEELMSRLHLHNGHMEYMDFVLNFGDPRPTDASNLIRNGNHRVNPIRGDQFGMTAEEVENKLRSKLRENFANLRGAFYKFDDNHSGCLTKKNFRRMLDSFMIVMSDEEYEKMCERHGITKSTCISYCEFLERFEVRDTAEGHKWLNSVHRYNETFPPKPLTAEEAHQTLKEKAYRQWNDLAKAFRQIDSKGNGIISRRELRDLLYRFVMPMNDDDFKKLWARYDEEGKGFISHSDFLEHLAAPEHAPGDFVGPSQRIIDGSRFNIELHNTLQQQRHEGITQKQANLTEHMSASEVIRQLKDKIRDSYADLYKAFCKYDTHNRGSLSVHDIQKVLVEQNFYITDEEFFLLLDMIGLRTDKARLNYSQFLAAFEDGRKSSYGRRPAEVRIEEYTELTAEDAENKLRQKLEKNIDDVSRTLAAIDKGETGRVLVDDMRRILDLYCFRMTTDQWRRVKARMSIGPDNCVDYASFLRNYIGNEHIRFDQAVQALQDAPPLPVYQLVTVDEVQERIQEAVRSHQPTIVRDLKDADYAGIGSVSRDAFREILNKHVMRLNDEQFERVWDLSPVNEYGNINYRDFLANYSDDVRIPSPPRTANPDTNRRPYTSMSVRPGSRMNLQRPASQMSRSYSRANSRCATPLVNAESAEQRLKDKVFRHWKDMQRQCRNLDHHNTGTISVSEFGDLLSQYNIDLPPQDFDSIVTKYDMKENCRFSYSEFLRHFMISMRPKDGSAITARKKLQPLRVPMEIQEEGSDLLTRVSACVSSNWKDMRREFKAVDQDGMGTVNELEFRRILRQFCANVSEEEFDTIVTTFDRTANGLVSYNDFVKKFIH